MLCALQYFIKIKLDNESETKFGGKKTQHMVIMFNSTKNTLFSSLSIKELRPAESEHFNSVQKVTGRMTQEFRNKKKRHGK